MTETLRNNTKKVWDTLVEIAQAKEEIQYSHLAERSGLVSDQSEAYAGQRPTEMLKIIQSFCMDNQLFPLTVLAHNWKGKRGLGYIRDPDLSIDEEIAQVHGFDWTKIGNPYKEQGRRSLRKQVAIVKAGSKKKRKAFAGYPYRAQQPAFRQTIIDYYGGCCAFCATNLLPVLDAAHIKPWSRCRDSLDKINPNNGLLLCKNHHYAFDAGLIWVANDLTIKFRTNKVEKQLVAKSRLTVPSSIDEGELKVFLAWSREDKNQGV